MLRSVIEKSRFKFHIQNQFSFSAQQCTCIVRQLGNVIQQTWGNDVERQGLTKDITDREKKVLELSALGMTKLEIGTRLSISVHTVDYHARNLLFKLNARNMTSAVAIAIRNDLIDPW